MTRYLWMAAVTGLAFAGDSTLTAGELRDPLSGLSISDRQPAWIHPVVDVGGIVDSAIRGDVPGVVASSVPNRYAAYAWGYYPWQRYVPRPYYGYPRYGLAYPYGYSWPRYGRVYRNDLYDYRYGDAYRAARPLSPGSGAYSAGSGAATPANPLAVPEAARIVNPAASGTRLSFMVDSQVYTLAPGAHQDVSGGPDRVIAFDRGGSYGAARYALRAGTYTFTATDKGWELYHEQPEPRQDEVIPAPEPTLAPF